MAHVLLIDDDPVLIQSRCTSLPAPRYRVEVAAQGRRARARRCRAS